VFAYEWSSFRFYVHLFRKTKRPAISTGRPVEQFSPEVLFVMGANDRQLHEIGK
jgi:hypothetical protein